MTLTLDRKAELLSAAHLFDGVDAEGMDRIAAVAVQVDFPANHVVARQGEIGTGFFVVVEGRVRVIRDGETVATLGPGDFFGEISIILGEAPIADIVAIKPLSCLVLAGPRVEGFLVDNPRVMWRMLQAQARRLRAANRWRS